MGDLGIFDRTIGLLGRTLDLRQQNHQAIASNIANAETPGYTPRRLEFEANLRRALGSGGPAPAATNPAHFSLPGSGGVDKVQAKVLRTPDGGIGDRNGVRADQEMIALAENQILYEAATQMMSKKLGLLKYVANDGR